MRDKLETLIKNALNIPVFDESESIVYPAATIGDYLESPELFGDGKCEEESTSISIGLWYEDRAARDEAAKTLKKSLVAAGYAAPTVHKYFDANSRKYRAVLDTEKIIEEE